MFVEKEELVPRGEMKRARPAGTYPSKRTFVLQANLTTLVAIGVVVLTMVKSSQELMYAAPLHVVLGVGSKNDLLVGHMDLEPEAVVGLRASRASTRAHSKKKAASKRPAKDKQ